MVQNLVVTQVADINPGPLRSRPYGFTEYRGELYFGAIGPEDGGELYKLARDGTPHPGRRHQSGK